MNITKIVENFSHDFLENALIAMINDLSLNMNASKIPVFIINTGDEAFIMDQNTAKSDNRDKETLYQQRPRIELEIKDIDFQKDEVTSPYQFGKFKLNLEEGTREFKTKVQRIPLSFGIGLTLVTDNILSVLKYSEILISILAKHNAYEFTYLSKVYTGSYSFNFSLTEQKNLTMGYDSDKRNRLIESELTLQLQYPLFNIFRKAPGIAMGDDKSYANGLTDSKTENDLVKDPDLTDITDGESNTKWIQYVNDKNSTFQTKTEYDGTIENPIPNHQTIKPK